MNFREYLELREVEFRRLKTPWAELHPRPRPNLIVRYPQLLLRYIKKQFEKKKKAKVPQLYAGNWDVTK